MKVWWTFKFWRVFTFFTIWHNWHLQQIINLYFLSFRKQWYNFIIYYSKTYFILFWINIHSITFTIVNIFMFNKTRNFLVTVQRDFSRISFFFLFSFSFWHNFLSVIKIKFSEVTDGRYLASNHIPHKSFSTIINTSCH